MIIRSDQREMVILPNVLLIDVGELGYDECSMIIEKVTWYKRIGIVENFEEIGDNSFIRLSSIIKPDHFYNHFMSGDIEFPNYDIIGGVSEKMFKYLIGGWESVAMFDKLGRFYRLWVDLRTNYKKYISEAMIKSIIE